MVTERRRRRRSCDLGDRIHLNTETGLAPMSSFGVVSIRGCGVSLFLSSLFKISLLACAVSVHIGLPLFFFISGLFLFLSFGSVFIYTQQRGVDRHVFRCFQNPFRHRWRSLVYLPDGVSSSQTNPLGDRTVLLLRSRKLLLGAERFLALQMVHHSTISSG